MVFPFLFRCKENKEEIKKRGMGWAGRVTDVLRKIFAGGGAGKGINESDVDTGKAYLVFMQPLAWW